MIFRPPFLSNRPSSTQGLVGSSNSEMIALLKGGQIGIASLPLILISFLGIQSCRMDMDQLIINQAYEIAATHIGDLQSPLTSSERATWYHHMQVKDGEQPSIGQLRSYISINSLSR